MYSILIASILLIPLFLLLLGIRSGIAQKVARLPSPPRLPFIGNLHQLGPILHLSLYKLAKKHGPLMLLHFGNVQTLVVSSPKIAEELFRNNDLDFANRPSSKVMNTLSYNKNGIAFSQYGEDWRQMRRIGIIHLLGSKRLKSFSIDRTEEVSMLLEKVADAASRGNGVVCLTEILDSYVTNLITKVILGSWISEEKRELFSKLVHESAALLSQVFLEDFFPNLKWLDVMRGLVGRRNNHEKRWDCVLEEVLKEHSNYSKKSKGENITYFIDALLELQKDSSSGFVITRDHIKAAVMDLISAGIDTSFTAVDWCMTELIRNPGVMKKVKEEVSRVANGEYLISEEHLAQMSYLKAFIKEVFRLHPPSPLLLPRESLHDCEILGYTIPKKTRLIINAWAFGRDESNWEAPEQFKPERFLVSTMDSKGKDFKVIPFGAGCRTCPGMAFAKVIIELTVANLLHRFDWSLPSGITVEDMDMKDSGEIVSSRIQKLDLVPIANKVN